MTRTHGHITCLDICHKIFKVILIILACIFVPTKAFDSETKLIIATFDFPPYEYRKQDNIDGLSVRIAKYVFNKINQPVEFIELPWSRSLMYLEQGKIDGLFEILWKPDRVLYADYCKEVLMYETSSLFIKKSSNISFNGDLNRITSYKIGIRQDFSYGVKFDKLRQQNKFKMIISSVDPEQLLRMLNQEKIDIRDKFDAALKALKDSGEYQEIIARWENEHIRSTIENFKN